MKLFSGKKCICEINEVETRDLKWKARQYDKMVKALKTMKDIYLDPRFDIWCEFHRETKSAEASEIMALQSMVRELKMEINEKDVHHKYKEKYDNLQQAIRDAHREILFFNVYDMHLRNQDPNMTFSEMSVKAMSEAIQTNENEIQKLLGKYNDLQEENQRLVYELNKLEVKWNDNKNDGELLGTIHALKSTINRLNLEIDAMKHMLDRLDGK